MDEQSYPLTERRGNGMTTERKITKNDLMLLIGTLIALFIMGMISNMYYPRLSRWLQHRPDQAVVLNADPTCNPTDRACTVGDAAMTITLKLGDRIQSLTAFPVAVALAGAAAMAVRKVAVSFAMTDMNMGINRFDLNRQADGTWQGQAVLPVCTMGRRDWRVTVEAVGDIPYIGEFHLLAKP